MSQTWSALPVPHAIEVPDRAPKERYYDPDFFALEAEQLWSRIWQMACRLEEIPEPGDFVEYEILDQSVIVVRGDDGEVRAFQNACRHRGVKLVEGRGTCEKRVRLPVPRLVLRPGRRQHPRPPAQSFAEHNLAAGDIDLTPVRCEIWGGCAWINLDDDAPPLRQCIEPIATILDAWKIESLRTEWWYAAPPARELEAGPAGLPGAVPRGARPTRSSSSPACATGPPDAKFDPEAFIDAEIQYLRTMSEGMAGMVHANDVAHRRGPARTSSCPPTPSEAMATWYRTLNDAVTELAPRPRAATCPTSTSSRPQGINEPMGYCFPHYFVLPDVQQRLLLPVPPARAGGDADGDLVAHPRTPRARSGRRRRRPRSWECDDPRWPPIPAQDFSNLPRQQQGLHAKGFEYMRLSEKAEGHLSNFERVDRRLPRRPAPRPAPAGPARGQRQPPDEADRRHHLRLTGGSDQSGSSSRDRSRSATDVTPSRLIVRVMSAANHSRTRLTPSSPAAARPQR